MKTETAKQAAKRLSAAIVAKGYRPIALHCYTDETGNPLYYRIRCKHPGTGEKWIRPMYANGNGWELAEPPATGRKPLYNLAGLAADRKAQVFVVEGEQKVDALVRLGLLATTSGSSSSAEAADWQILARRRVIVWPDNDPAGLRYAAAVDRILSEMACTIDHLDAGRLGLPEKGDVMDWLAAHPDATAAAVEALPRRQRTVPGTADNWPDPKPLPSGLPGVAEFAPALLPDRLRGWLLDVAERMQCPPDFPAVAGMVAGAAVLGRKVGIRPKRRDDWLEVANVWGALIGPPGVMKSPAIGEAFRPLRRLEAQAFELYEEELAAYTRQKDLAKLQRDATRHKVLTRLKKGETATAEDLGDEVEIEEPSPRRYVVNDSSVEALGEILRYNPNGILAYRDELAGLLKSLDKEGNEESRAFYLSAWNGKEGYTFDRIGRGLNLRIEACSLCVFGSIQPGIVGPYLREAVANGGDDGLLARFGLLVWPDVAGDWRNVDRFPDTQAKAAAFEVFARLDTMQEIGETDEDGGIPFLRFDDAAQELFTEWRIGFEKRLRQGAEHPALEAHLSKYRKLVPALALLLHLADAQGPVSERALLKSLAWSEYSESHARRAYASVMAANIDGARALLNRITRNREDVPNPFTLRDVYLRGWSGLPSPEDARQAAEVLADLDVLRRETVETAGRPKTQYTINPRVRP